MVLKLAKIMTVLKNPLVMATVVLVSLYVVMTGGLKMPLQLEMPSFDTQEEPDNWPTENPEQSVDLGMYDVYNPNAFGTTKEEDRRVTNDGVRREFHTNPFPWAECNCGDCDEHGVPEPAMGHTHVCKNGFPSKRIVDMYGGHFQLNHICAPGDGKCADEPAVLGRWWCRKGCTNAESVGLNVRPVCTRCK